MSEEIVTTAGAVVVEIDGSADGLRVVDYATMLAMRDGRDLVLVRPYRTVGTYTAGARFHPPCQRDEAGRDLREAVAHVRRQAGPRLPVGAVAREGFRIDVLSQFGRRAEVLVVPRQRVRGPQRLVAAQADIALAARSACPVVVVPRTWKPFSGDRTVVVGIDGSALSWEAVGHAFSTASRTGGDLLALHAAGDDRPGSGDLERVVAETLAGWQEVFPDVRVVRRPTTEPVLAALARGSEHAALLVLGVHVDRNRTIGDPVTRQALAAATCPVALVRHQVTFQGDRRPRSTATATRVLNRS
jgi:nucleotide-binding universal stress UspA family protein